MGRRFERPPLWATITMALSAVALAVMTPLALQRAASPPAAAAPGSVLLEPVTSPPAESSPQASAAAGRRITIAVLGDSYTSGSPMDSGRSAEWPALLSRQYPWDVVPFAAAGTGFVAGQETGTSFAARADQVIAARPAVVVVEGGHEDSTRPLSRVRTAARDLIARLHTALPEAKLVVLGVLWPGSPPPTVTALNAALRNIAEEAGATFVDPVATGWLSGPNQSLIGSDGVHPTDEGHAALARDVAAALAVIAGVPATG